jgi:hypothetical protein
MDEWPQVTAPLASCIAAGTGTVSAIAAWRSAKASQRTSHDAMRALAIGIEPRLTIERYASEIPSTTPFSSRTAPNATPARLMCVSY